MKEYCRLNFFGLMALATLCAIIIILRIWPDQYALLVGVGGGSCAAGLAFGIAYIFTSKT